MYEELVTQNINYVLHSRISHVCAKKSPYQPLSWPKYVNADQAYMWSTTEKWTCWLKCLMERQLPFGDFFSWLVSQESNAFKNFSCSMSVPFSLPDLHLAELAHSRHSDGFYLLTDWWREQHWTVDVLLVIPCLRVTEVPLRSWGALLG